MSLRQRRKPEFVFFASLIAVLGSSPVAAQEEEGPPPSKDIEIRVGAGTLIAPAFLGSKNYQALAVPELKITYKDEFFASQEDGIGYAVISQDGWMAGPIGRVAFERPENGRNPLSFGGGRTNALRGLGSVGTTFEAGAFVENSWRSLTSRVELRKGVNGHEGVIGSIGTSYSGDIHGAFYTEGPPLILALGPHITVADGRYERAYFGIDALQSERSGLPRYRPGGGALSFGGNATLILPITYQISATLLAGYDRLAGDAADAPLVRLRGSPNQATAGLIISYSFGFDAR